MFRYLDLQILKSKRFVFDVYELVSTIFEESHFGESQKDDIQDCYQCKFDVLHVHLDIWCLIQVEVVDSHLFQLVFVV